jgi:hypothetical protein
MCVAATTCLYAVCLGYCRMSRQMLSSVAWYLLQPTVNEWSPGMLHTLPCLLHACNARVLYCVIGVHSVCCAEHWLAWAACTLCLNCKGAKLKMYISAHILSL